MIASVLALSACNKHDDSASAPASTPSSAATAPAAMTPAPAATAPAAPAPASTAMGTPPAEASTSHQ